MYPPVPRSLAAFVLTVTLGCATPREAWWQARRDSSGQAPDPGDTREAVIQVYAARAVSWRGLLAVHTWIALKPANARQYTRYEVIGWGVGRGFPAVRVNRMDPDITGSAPGGAQTDLEASNLKQYLQNAPNPAHIADPDSRCLENSTGSRPVAENPPCVDSTPPPRPVRRRKPARS